ncbi:MAG: hypothetical protein NTX09_16180, partial [Verrucomicrobia bacterium]|nr:hypothetical protein [Verrucomicrobiota bacterium]
RPAERHAIARQPAEFARDGRSAALPDLAAHLSAPPATSIDMLTASFFPAVAAATNAGWQHEQSSATSL